MIMITMEHTAKYTAKQIAHWFIWRNKIAEDMEGGDPLSLLKLLKLMHYAEGSFLATAGPSHETIIDAESVFRIY